MKLKLHNILFLAALLIFSCNNDPLENDPEEQQDCDNGTFVGNVLLNTQQEVNDFALQCYSKIEGRLYIGRSGFSNDIVDISALEELTEVFPGRIYVHAKDLVSLSGLHNIEKVGGITLFQCDNLENLDGLSSLITIGDIENPEIVEDIFEGLHIHECESLTNIEGLQNLQRVKSISILGNTFLTSLDGLENLQTLGIPHGSEAYDNYGHITIGIGSGCFGNHQSCVNPNLNNICAL